MAIPRPIQVMSKFQKVRGKALEALGETGKVEMPPKAC